MSCKAWDKICIFLVYFLLVTCSGEGNSRPRPTVSPKTEFVAAPRNVTVLEGHPAVLRCKLKDTVHNCQWFYLEFGLDMFDERAQPVLVIEFRPKKSSDCSIKFNQARLIQTGQWICKGLQIHARKYIVSEPAFLQVLQSDGASEKPTGQSEPPTTKDEETRSSGISFVLSDEGHIVNANLGEPATLSCQANKGLQGCSWIKPDGTTLKFHVNSSGNYEPEGHPSDGNCSLRIHEVTGRDEGNWRCVVSVDNQTDKKLGPLIHLHVLEFGIHGEGQLGLHGDSSNDPSLIIILVVTSVVLLFIIVILVLYMYKKVWGRHSPPHKYLESNADYSTYGTPWLRANEPKDQKLIEDSKDMRTCDDPSGNDYKRYLEMRGMATSEDYVKFPESSGRSSVSSRTTGSTVPVGQNVLGDGDHSVKTSGSGSLQSSGKSVEALQGRPLPMRQDSTYSQGHLYEDIDELKLRRAMEQEKPQYSNTEVDQEGYMVPKRSNQKQFTKMKEPENSSSISDLPETTKLPTAPPYSKVGENGLVPDTETNNTAFNPTYLRISEQPDDATSQDSYDVPSEPPVPLRIDSVDNPLAEYDVPKKSSQENLQVFV